MPTFHFVPVSGQLRRVLLEYRHDSTGRYESTSSSVPRNLQINNRPRRPPMCPKPIRAWHAHPCVPGHVMTYGLPPRGLSAPSFTFPQPLSREPVEAVLYRRAEISVVKHRAQFRDLTRSAPPQSTSPRNYTQSASPFYFIFHAAGGSTLAWIMVHRPHRILRTARSSPLPTGLGLLSPPCQK
ncbi:hypothetical protein LY78DRAFT_416979 [Colletotrichum sublineola]|nr:hypothetical protein LY78DRAFT_416979 [Colletotrichum sublineola]